jgi:hypothetical protein
MVDLPVRDRREGEGRIIRGKSNKTSRIRSRLSAGLVIQEIMQTKPGRQTTTSVSSAVRSVVGTHGRGAGSFIAFQFVNEVIHYWALDGAGILREPLPILRQPARGDRHLMSVAQRCGTAGRTRYCRPCLTTAMNTSVLQDFHTIR